MRNHMVCPFVPRSVRGVTFALLSPVIMLACESPGLPFEELEPLDPETLPPVVRSFAFTQGLNPLRAYEELLSEPARGVLFFSLAWGPPLDCPSGCYYESAFGIAQEERVGWISFTPYGLSDPLTAGGVFDIAATDEYLVDPNLLIRLRAVDGGLYGNYRLLLSCDADVPEATLRHIADTIAVDGWPLLARALLEHPAVLTSVEILRVLTALQGMQYSSVRTRAQEVLDAIDQGLAPPPIDPAGLPVCAASDSA